LFSVDLWLTVVQRTLAVDIGDTRFAASAVSGSVFNNMKAVAYGVAANCVSSSPSGWKTSVVDLRGTVTVRGGGFCGTNHPGPGPLNLGNYCNLQWLMQLKIANASTAGLPPVLPDCLIPMPNGPFVGGNSCCNSTCAFQRDSALPNVTCTTPAPTPLPTPAPTPLTEAPATLPPIPSTTTTTTAQFVSTALVASTLLAMTTLFSQIGSTVSSARGITESTFSVTFDAVVSDPGPVSLIETPWFLTMIAVLACLLISILTCVTVACIVKKGRVAVASPQERQEDGWAPVSRQDKPVDSPLRRLSGASSGSTEMVSARFEPEDFNVETINFPPNSTTEIAGTSSIY
jgi:hypothetical protein